MKEKLVLEIEKPRHCTAVVDETTIFYREAGRADAPGLLLLHGFPSSSHSFRHIIGPLARVARVVAPDLPGFGFTEVPADYDYSFEAIGRTLDAFTRAIGLDRFFLYVHDFGAPVAYHLALGDPGRILGLIVQNGNAHEEGLGESWQTARAFFADPTAENRAALPEWLNFEGIRDQYVGEGVPDRIKSLIPPETWHLDWERMSRPGMIDIQFEIFSNYGQYIRSFEQISAYHRVHQPRTLLLWGRHDIFFEVEEVLAYARELERIDMHIFDGAHFLLETHHEECAGLMSDFILDTVLCDDLQTSTLGA